jgi:glycosyltransferase involved in cell wall biosynthesis
MSFFSIAMPTYSKDGSGLDFLKFNFNILKNQTFKDFEVVISDNSDNDDVEKICNEYKSFLNIKYLKNPSKNKSYISPNLNNALRNCKGKWIKVLFMDDFLYDENSLKKHYDTLISDHFIKWLITSFCHSNDGYNFYRKYDPKMSHNIWSGNNTLGNPSNLTIKNEDLIYFDENLNWLVDCEYYHRLFLKYENPYILRDITVVNRTHGGGTSDSMTQEQINKELKKMKEKYDEMI